MRIFVLILLAFLTGCSAPAPSSKTAKVPARVNPPDAAALEKAVNVSFSTYSPDWPVGWEWIDPDDKTVQTPKDVKKGVLRMRIPTGKNMVSDNLSSPRYMKPIKGDFEIETQVAFLPKENYQGAGLLVYVDAGRYIRFERAFGGTGGGGEGIRLDVREGANYKVLATPDDIPTQLAQIDVKIVRRGNAFTAYWRENELSTWREAGAYESDYPQTVTAGLVAANTAREITAEFNYIRLAPVAR